MSVVPGHFYGKPKERVQVNLVTPDPCPAGHQLVSLRRTHHQSDPQNLVELAQSVQNAGDFVTAGATNKLLLIAEQIKFLQMQAQNVLEEAKRDQELHSAACNMKKVPGNIYYLYKSHKTQQAHFSLLSPQDWGESCPNEFLGAYKLEFDMSWTPADDIINKSQPLNKMMSAVTAYTRSATTSSTGPGSTRESARSILALADS